MSTLPFSPASVVITPAAIWIHLLCYLWRLRHFCHTCICRPTPSASLFLPPRFFHFPPTTPYLTCLPHPLPLLPHLIYLPREILQAWPVFGLPSHTPPPGFTHTLPHIPPACPSHTTAYTPCILLVALFALHTLHASLPHWEHRTLPLRCRLPLTPRNMLHCTCHFEAH